VNKNIFVFTVVISGLISLFGGCELIDNPNEEEAKENNGYQTEKVGDIFNLKCGTSGCHSGSNAVNGFVTSTQPEIILGASDRPDNGTNYGGDNVIAYDLERSLLYQFITGNLSTPLSVDHTFLANSEMEAIKEWIEDGAMNSLNVAPYTTPNSYRVYCCNSGDESISVIDGTEYVVGKVVDLDEGETSEDSPYWIEEYGDYYYVTLDKAGSLLKFRKSNNTLVGRIDNLIDPGLIRINLTGTKAYVSRSLNSTSTFNSIYVINTLNMTVTHLIILPINGLPHGMALDFTRGYLYVADAYSNVIYVIDSISDIIIDLNIRLEFNYLPLFVELPPYGTYIYVTTQGINSLQVIAANNRLIVGLVPLKSNPSDIAVTTDGQKIFVASSGGNVVEIVTRVTNFWSKTGEINHPAFSMPFGIDITVDDRYLFVSNINTNGAFTPAYQVKGEGNISTVGIINVQTESVIKVIEVEENAAAIVVEKNLN